MSHADKIAGLCVSYSKRLGTGQRSRAEEETCIHGANSSVQEEQGQYCRSICTAFLSFSLFFLQCSAIRLLPTKDITVKIQLTELLFLFFSFFFTRTDRNRSQIRPARSDSVPESFSDKDGLCKTGLLESPKPTVQAASSPDLGTVKYLTPLRNYWRTFVRARTDKTTLKTINTY